MISNKAWVYLVASIVFGGLMFFSVAQTGSTGDTWTAAMIMSALCAAEIVDSIGKK